MQPTGFALGICVFFISVALNFHSTNALPFDVSAETPQQRALEYNLQVKAYPGTTTESSFLKQIAGSISDVAHNAYDKVKDWFETPGTDKIQIYYPGYYLVNIPEHLTQAPEKKKLKIVRKQRISRGQIVMKEIPKVVEDANRENSNSGYININVQGVASKNRNRQQYQKQLLRNVKNILEDSIRFEKSES